MKRLGKGILMVAAFLLLPDCGGKEHNQSKEHSTTPKYVLAGERQTVAIGDTLILTGGVQGYLKDNYGCDNCAFLVQGFTGSKPLGQLAILVPVGGDGNGEVPVVSLYYHSAELGYLASTLYMWERSLTEAEDDALNRDWVLPFENREVDQAIKFRVKP